MVKCLAEIKRRVICLDGFKLLGHGVVSPVTPRTAVNAVISVTTMTLATSPASLLQKPC